MSYLLQRFALMGLVSSIMMMLGSDGASTMNPMNRAVLQGASRVVMSCSSDTAAEAISWGYLPVGGSAGVDITYGLFVYDTQKQYYAVEKSGDKQNNLIILNATMARAGTYICREGISFQASAQLIVLYSDPVCSTTPDVLKDLLYNQTVQMSCSISYTANTSYVMVDMIWSKDGSDAVVVSSTPNTTTSSTLTTAVSTITQTPGFSKSFPIYRCNTTFKISGSPPSGSTNAPDYSKSTQLFNSSVNVIYLKPADASSITGATDGDRVYLGTTLKCKVDANPSASYSWLDVMYGNTTNSSSIEIWHDGEFRCTAWNNAGSTSVSINVTTYITTTVSTTTTTATSTTTVSSRSTIASGSDSTASTESPVSDGLSDRDKIIIGVVVGVGGALLIVAVTILICCCLKKKNKADKYSGGSSEGTLSKPPPYDDNNGHRGPQRSSNPDLVQGGGGGGYAMDDYPSPKQRSSLSSPYSTNSQQPYIDDEGLNYAQIQLDNNPRSRQPLQMAEETNYTDVRLA